MYRILFKLLKSNDSVSSNLIRNLQNLTLKSHTSTFVHVYFPKLKRNGLTDLHTTFIVHRQHPYVSYGF